MLLIQIKAIKNTIFSVQKLSLVVLPELLILSVSSNVLHNSAHPYYANNSNFKKSLHSLNNFQHNPFQCNFLVYL